MAAATSEYDYDLFTIGAGSGGVRASRMSASYGGKVAVRTRCRKLCIFMPSELSTAMHVTAQRTDDSLC